MATIEEAIVEKLKPVTTKVYPLSAPKGIKAPYVVYERQNTGRLPTLSENGAFRPAFRISIVEATYFEMIGLRTAVRKALEYQSGEYLSNAPEVQNCLIINEDEMYNSETNEFIGILEIQLFYN